MCHVKAHPRSRGENLLQVLSELVKRGSSPLTRGKRVGPLVLRGRRRLIPAHAGKTCQRPGHSVGKWAHPRSRGENSRLAAHGAGHPGSSPLTRGKHRRPKDPAGHHRLIPAHAGKTRRRMRWRIRCQAHPRSRGENDLEKLGGSFETGSSPLTRGKHIALYSQAAERLAHPRSRGENPGLPVPRGFDAGSSPLTRGKLKLTTY